MSRVAAVCLVLVLTGFAQAQPLTPLEELGKALLLDQNLSTPIGQSCVACHGAEVGFTGPISAINAAGAVYPGAIHTRFGNRKPPAASYAGDSPVLYFDQNEEVWIGGMFWDGRATGWTLGDPLAEQAQGPFLNPLEQNVPQLELVVRKVARASYASLFEQVWGPNSLPRYGQDDLDEMDLPSRHFDFELAYERIARSIAAYERSAEVNPFTSKYDYYLAGQVTLTPEEERGLALFNGQAQCSACHPSEPGPSGEPPVFTDFTYDNLGTPKNLQNPFYGMPRKWNPAGAAWIDFGLGGFLVSAGFPPEVYEPELGKQKVPTLRNIDLRPSPGFVKAYTHNGFFKSLEELVSFYNTRDLGGWPPPEVPVNVNTSELGNLGLTPAQEADLVAFLKTLSDGYQIP